MVYAGFWRRLWAGFIDCLVLLPVSGFAAWGTKKYPLFDLYWIIPNILIYTLFYVYLVYHFGGTPGKLSLNMRILMLDGTTITKKAAWLRYIPFIFLTALLSLTSLLSHLHIIKEVNFSSGFLSHYGNMEDTTSLIIKLLVMIAFIFSSCDIITMMCNKKRRTIKDFIAGTVVVRDE